MAARMALLASALLVALSSALPTGSDQLVLLHKDQLKQRPEKYDSEQELVKVMMTFDGYELEKTVHRSIDHYHYLDFTNYDAVDVAALASKGGLHKGDTNCAVSGNNAIFPTNSTGPQKSSVIWSNETALAKQGLSPYFDFVELAIKPLVTYNVTIVEMEFNAWKIVDGVAKDATAFNIGFFMEDGDAWYPFFMQPGQWIPGWGVGVNVIELKMFDDKGNPAGFCIDDIVIDYHPLEGKK